MAKTALTQLQDQIEAIRREAFEAGYAAAMQAIRDFAVRPPAASPTAVRARGRRKLPTAKPAVASGRGAAAMQCSSPRC
jgi:hypothetical protein